MVVQINKVAETQTADLFMVCNARETFQQSYKAMRILTTSARSPILQHAAIKMASRGCGKTTEDGTTRKMIMPYDAVHHSRLHDDSFESAASYASHGPVVELNNVGLSEHESSSDSDCTLSRNGSITSTDSPPVGRLVVSSRSAVARQSSAPLSSGRLRDQGVDGRIEGQRAGRRSGGWRSNSDERKIRVRFEENFDPTSESSNSTPSDNETESYESLPLRVVHIDIDEKPFKIERIHKKLSHPNLVSPAVLGTAESGHVRKASCPEFARKGSAQETEQSKSKSGFRKFSWQIGERGTPKLSRKLSFQGEKGDKKTSERKISEPLPEYQPLHSPTPDKSKFVWKVLRRKLKKEKKPSVESMEGSGSFPSMPDLGCGERLGARYRLLSPSRREGSSFSESESGESSLRNYVADSTEAEEQRIPACPFNIWSEGKVDINLGSSTLPLLHVAAGEGNLELIKTLVSVGVDIDEGDDQGWPAVHYAVCAGHFNCASYLIARGANISAYSSKVTNRYCSAIRNVIRTSDVNL